MEKLSEELRRAHRGAFQGKEGVANIALEAAVDCRLWFWHAWFGMPGANNDLTIWIVLRFSMICQIEGLQK